MTQARFDLDDYTIKVLDVFKAKFALKNRNEALNRFVKEYGENYAEPEINPEVIKHFNNVLREHTAKYGKKGNKMSLKELENHLGMDD
jgi:hypothetical protein